MQLSPPTSRSLGLATLIGLLLLAGACSGVLEVPAARRGRIPDDAAYLLAPSLGYALALSPAVSASLESAHRKLVETGSTEDARRISNELLRLNPDLDPATVLRAQAELVDGEYTAVFESLAPVVERAPEYDAASMVFARAAELLEKYPEALVSYGSLADRSQLAAARFSAVKPQAVETLSTRVSEALARRRLDAARSNLAVLQRWAPRDVSTLSSAAAVAVAQNDKGGELDALRELASVSAMEQELVLRRARLELEVGDAGAGLRILQDLAASEPENGRLSAELARAKFLWRLELLPEKVRELARAPVLRRGDLAAMLYWLFPSVRYGRAEAGRIANDVLDHTHRQEIVRVANLGIMSVDPRLHRFEPDRVLSRAAAIVPILRILGRQRPLPACLAGYDVSTQMSPTVACDLAVRCGLVDENGECLSSAEASGGAAIEWTRRALDNLGVE
jgi:hypothetical protein